MAEVTSLTAERILQITGQYSGIPAEQEDLRALIALLRTYLEQNQAELTEIRESTLPSLEAILSENDLALSDLNTNVIADLDARLEQNSASLEDLETVTLPALQESLSNNTQIVLESPKVYVQNTPPENPDEDYRDLVVGDSWFNPDDNNVQKVWNGVEWSSFNVDIPDLSITVKKFNTSTHMIY